jgi:hypothetical protein
MTFGAELDRIDPITLRTAYEAVLAKLVQSNESGQSMVDSLVAQSPGLDQLHAIAVDFATRATRDPNRVGDIMAGANLVIFTIASYAIGEDFELKFS